MSIGDKAALLDPHVFKVLIEGEYRGEAHNDMVWFKIAHVLKPGCYHKSRVIPVGQLPTAAQWELDKKERRAWERR